MAKYLKPESEILAGIHEMAQKLTVEDLCAYLGKTELLVDESQSSIEHLPVYQKDNQQKKLKVDY